MASQRYTAQITRKNPSAFIFMVDCSSSMSAKVTYNGINMSKAEALSLIINTIISEIVARCRRADGYRNYFKIGVLGYRDNSTEMLLDYIAPNKPMLDITDIAEADIDEIVYESIRKAADGATFVSSVKTPRLLTPLCSGNTPMGLAYKEVYKIVKDWVSEHYENCFAPIVINITDGQCTDSSESDLIDITNKIKSTSTSDGNTLLFNIHLSPDSSKSGVIFPSSIEEINAEDRYANLLFNISSDLPEIFHREVYELKPKEYFGQLPIKAMGYNSSMAELIRMMNIGSLSVNKIG